MLTRDDLIAVGALFDELVDLAPDARAAMLAARGPIADAVRDEVETLLAAHGRLEGFLERADLAAAPSAPPAPRVGRHVGPWRLVRLIGEGGMSEIYLAERADGAFAGHAAVKFMRAHLGDTASARRFAAERQVLAALRHPNIVALLDGGATADGEGYLVMEYVEGRPITEACRGRALDARLALVRQACAAVQYAHERSVVHRDLKPGNILVTTGDVVKVLDFGVAKLLEHAGAEGDLTQMQPAPLTPNYASPEQLRSAPLTTATDVYSLGVLLYEAVTGRRPYETAGRGLDDVMRVVTDTEPPRPSEAARNTETPLPYPQSRLRGDLDAVVLKALRKDPQERYRSAGELGDDLSRFLSGSPVVAREPSAAYTLRRLAARHRAAFVAAALAALAVLIALGVAVAQWQRAEREGVRAAERLRQVRQLANALIFKIHDRVATLPGSTPVRREIVAEALTYLQALEREAAEDESLQLELGNGYRQIGNILGDPQFPNLGDRAGALAQVEKSRDLLLPLADRPDAAEETIGAAVNTLRVLARIRRIGGDNAGAAAAIEDAERLAQRAFDRGLPLGRDMLARVVFDRANTTPHGPGVRAIWERAMALWEELLAEAPEDPARQRGVALTAKYLGGFLSGERRYDEALRYYQRAVELDERRLAKAPDDPLTRLDTAISLAQVGTVAESRGDDEQALAAYQRSLPLRQQAVAADPEDVFARVRAGWLYRQIAEVYWRLGQRETAYAHARDAVAHLERVVGTAGDGDARADLGSAWTVLGRLERGLGRPAAACAAFRRAVATFPSAEIRFQLRRYPDEARRELASCR